MTDSSDSSAPRSSRKKPAREPATIDLTATVVDAGSRPEDTASPKDEVAEEATIPAGAEPLAEEAIPEASFDAGAGTDSIASEEPPRAAAPQPSPEPKRSPIGAILASGLVGGVIGAGLVYGLQTWQASAPQPDPRLAQLEQRVAAMGQTGNLQALDKRIGTLEAAQAAAKQRFEAVQGVAEQAAARAEEAMTRPLPAAPAPQNNGAINELSTRLSAAENQLRGAAQSATGAASAAQALDRRMSEQDQRIVALTRQVAEEGKGAEAASQSGIRLILTERIRGALENGESYAAVLSALRRTGGDASRLAPLEPFAEKGAPTAAALAQGFKPLGAAILRDERASSGDWTDRLLRMADRIVTVRPVNEPGSTSVPALVARIEQSLARGDVADAVAAWETLPEPSRRLSEDWAKQAKARAEADRAAEALSAAALAALNTTTQQ